MAAHELLAYAGADDWTTHVDGMVALHTPPTETTEATVSQQAAFRERLVGTHAAREAFQLVVCMDGQRLLGFVYGYMGAAGQYWTDWIARTVPPSG